MVLNTAPLITIARAPNRLVRHPATGPKRPADASARDPTHAEREMSVFTTLSIVPSADLHTHDGLIRSPLLHRLRYEPTWQQILTIFVVYLSLFEQETLIHIFLLLKYIFDNHSYGLKDISMSRNDVDAVIGESTASFR